MKRIPRVLTLLVLSLITLAPITGCKVNEATGRNQLLLLDWEDELRLGTDAAPEFLDQSGGEVPDEAILAYVRDLGYRLAAESEMADIEWEFHVLDSSVINAFALPGGQVFISRGLMAEMTNEAQLAGVIGHEIGHVTARHGNERMSQAMVVQIGVISAGVAGAVSDSEWMGLLGVGTAVGGQLYLLQYSRSNETEADWLGVRYMTRNGYNPLGQIQVMEILREAGGGGSTPEWLSTHPAPDTRISDLEDLIEEEYPDYDQPGVYVFNEQGFKANVLDRLAQLPPPNHPGENAFMQPDEFIEFAGVSIEEAGCQHGGCDHLHSH